MPANGRSCGTCRDWREGKAGMGECRTQPPVWGKAWPTTHEAEWCRAYVPDGEGHAAADEVTQ